MYIKNNIKYLESYYTEITVGNNKIVFLALRSGSIVANEVYPRRDYC